MPTSGGLARRSVSDLRIFAALVALSASAHADTGGSWQPLQSMDVARQEIAVARVGDFIYVVGGLLASFDATDVVEAYDVSAGMWSTVAPLPAALHHTTAAALDGKVYVVGGYRVGFTPEEETFVYDPVMNEWSPGPPLPEPRGAGWMVAFGEKLYHFGGDGLTGASATTYVFDPATGWSQAMPMPTPREHTNAVVVGEFIYVIGGRAGSSTAANERYDPATNDWVSRSPMPTARSAMAMAELGGKIYCMGGEIPQLFDVNEVYDPVGNDWECRQPMAIPRHGVAAVALTDRIFVPAGGVVQGLAPTDAVDSFVPDDLVPVDPDDGRPVVPSSAHLAPAAPNPFSSATTFRFALDVGTPVSLGIYDASGRLVRQLLTGARMSAGEHGIRWDGVDSAGNVAAPGIYVVRLRSGTGETQAGRVIRLR